MPTLLKADKPKQVQGIEKAWLRSQSRPVVGRRLVQPAELMQLQAQLQGL